MSLYHTLPSVEHSHRLHTPTTTAFPSQLEWCTLGRAPHARVGERGGALQGGSPLRHASAHLAFDAEGFIWHCTDEATEHTHVGSTRCSASAGTSAHHIEWPWCTTGACATTAGSRRGALPTNRTLALAREIQTGLSPHRIASPTRVARSLRMRAALCGGMGRVRDGGEERRVPSGRRG
jgi:hypothetical protein